ncbi:MAG: class I SAM-dependent methyltransferase [Candidatus Levybacteria bacterium]|nr:class I SAM-dependent methyltransferase [Candidatus Levybacteria bacterium]
MKQKHDSLPTIKPLVVKELTKILNNYHNNITEIVDLGAGSQPQIFLALKDEFIFNYCAIDKDIKKLELFRERSKVKLSKKLRTVCSNVENTPLKSSSYNIIIFLETIEHLKYPEKALKEIVRIAKQNATIFISTPNIQRPDIYLKRVLFFLIRSNKNYPKDYYYSPDHTKEWKIKDFNSLLKKSNLIPIKSFLVTYPLEFVGFKSLVTLIIYSLINIIMLTFKIHSFSPIYLTLCKVDKK